MFPDISVGKSSDGTVYPGRFVKKQMRKSASVVLNDSRKTSPFLVRSGLLIKLSTGIGFHHYGTERAASLKYPFFFFSLKEEGRVKRMDGVDKPWFPFEVYLRLKCQGNLMNIYSYPYPSAYGCRPGPEP